MRGTLTFCCLAAAVFLCYGHLSRAPGAFENAHLTPLEPADSCATAFTVGGYAFDLSSLSLPTGGYIANNTVNSKYYCINLCRNVNSDRNCICNACGGQEYPATEVTDTNSTAGVYGDEVCDAYLGQLPDTTWTLLPPTKPRAEPQGVLLTYGGGQGGKSTEIKFLCDPTATGITIPQFKGIKGLLYSFTWTSASACGKAAE